MSSNALKVLVEVKADGNDEAWSAPSHPVQQNQLRLLIKLDTAAI